MARSLAANARYRPHHATHPEKGKSKEMGAEKVPKRTLSEKRFLTALALGLD